MANNMTIFRALGAAMAPYALPKATIEFLLMQQGLSAEDEYTPSVDHALYSAVVEGLMKVKSLKKESDPGTENDYDVAKVDDMIDYYRKKYDIEDPTSSDFIDRTDEW